MKCWCCGDEATTTRTVKRLYDLSVRQEPSTYYRSYCDKCFEEVERKEKEEKKEYIRLKKKEMFYKACDILENQHTDMYDYKEAIEAVEDYILEKPDKFDSSYEVLTAIVLIYNRIHCKLQYKIGKYQVDFLLPEYGVILEIDGERHQHRKKYDSERDAFIKNTLGVGWEIIRINTDYLDKDAKKLPYAIDKVIEYRETNHINWNTL